MKKYFSLAILVAVLLVTGVYVNSVRAGDSSDGGSGGSGGDGWVSGWAWASNIGWVSFNFQDSGAGGTIPYFVQIDTSGNFSGYAWSSNIGWISFNASSLTQSPACPSSAPAHVNPATGAVTGWIRATAGIGRSDGWDGCIELSGDKHASPDNGTVVIGGTSYKKGGVTYDTVTGVFDGFAWGGPVVGWLNFNPKVAGVNPVSCPPGTCPITNTNTIGGTCTMNGNSGSLTVNKGDTVAFSVTPAGGTGPYTYSWGTGEGVFPSAPPSSTSFSHQYSGALTAFPVNVAVTDSSGTVGSVSCGSLTVVDNQVQNNIKLSIGKTLAEANSGKRDIRVKKGNPFVLKWENSLLSQGYECDATVSNAGPWTGWGSTGAGNSSFNASGASVNIGTTYTFSISCSKDLDFQPSLPVTLKVVSSSLEEI